MPCAADELYVRNRLFKGKTSGSAADLWVELLPFAKALKVELTKSEGGGYRLASDSGSVAAETLKVNETVVSLRSEDGVLYCPLKQTATLLNARVVANSQLQTIDVNILPPSAGRTGDAGAWGDKLQEHRDAEAAKEAEAAERRAKKKPGLRAGSFRLFGKVTLPGADMVGLFENGSATQPYKIGRVDEEGNYFIDIDLKKDMHQFQPGVLITDVRFFKNGAFEMLHGRCNFLYYKPESKEMTLSPYGTGENFKITGRKFEYNEAP